MKFKKILTHILTLCFVLLAFAYSYVLFSHNGLPIGWDTPRYVWQIAYAADDLMGFIAENGGYNVLYAVFGSFFVRIGVAPRNIEIFLPPIFTFILITEIIRNLSLLTSGKDLHVRVLTALSWFAVFRVGADLHASLLSLIFSFQALYSLSKYYKNQKIRSLATALISIFLSSLAHIETTFFFTVIIMAGSSHSGGVMAVGVAIPLWVWLLYLGPLGLFSLPGLYHVASKCRKKMSFLIATTFIWGSVSIVMGLIQYVFPYFFLVIFAERALILYPGSFLAQITISKLHRRQSFQKYWKKIAMATLIVMVIITFSYTSYFSYRVFLPSAKYQKLLWIKENYGDKDPILIVDDFDEYAGIQGDLYDNWVKALVGIKSCVYLGNPYYLNQKLSTPYFNPVSTQISNKFLNTISKRTDDMSNVTMIYVEDLNNPSLPPKYYLTVMENVHNGVYVVNNTKLSYVNDFVKVPLYRAKAIQGKFYSVQRDWTESEYALELGEPKIMESNRSCKLKFAINNKGVYHMIIRYWDANIGTSLALKVDNTYVSNLKYSGLAEPSIATIFRGFLESGEHTLTIEVRGSYACLDYVEIRFNAINETGY